MVTFHPTFSYEDFIEGITAKTRDGDLVYEPEAGVFKEMAEDAVKAYEDADSKADAPRYILIIDEVNRGTSRRSSVRRSPSSRTTSDSVSRTR